MKARKFTIFALSSFASPRLLWNIKEFEAKNILQTITHNQNNARFRDSVLVCKMHDWYQRVCKNFEQHSIHFHLSDASAKVQWVD